MTSQTPGKDIPRTRLGGGGPPRSSGAREYPPLTPDSTAALRQALLDRGFRPYARGQLTGVCVFPHDHEPHGTPLIVDAETGGWSCFSTGHLPGVGTATSEGVYAGGPRHLSQALGLWLKLTGHSVRTSGYTTSQTTDNRPWANRLREGLDAWSRAKAEAVRLASVAREAPPDDKAEVEKQLESARTAQENAARALARVYQEHVDLPEEKDLVAHAFPAPRDEEGRLIKPDVYRAAYARQDNPRHVRELTKLKQNWVNASSANYKRKVKAAWTRAWLAGELAMGETLYYTTNDIAEEDTRPEVVLWERQRKQIVRAQGRELHFHARRDGRSARHVISNRPFSTQDDSEAQPLEDPLTLVTELLHHVQPLRLPIWKKEGEKGRVSFGQSDCWVIPHAPPNGEWLLLGSTAAVSHELEVQATCIIAGVKTWKAERGELDLVDPEVVFEGRHYQLPMEWGSDEALAFFRRELGFFLYPTQADQWAWMLDSPARSQGVAGGGEP